MAQGLDQLPKVGGENFEFIIEVGKIVFVKGSPLKMVEALAHPRLTCPTIRQNAFWAFFYNAAAGALAVLDWSIRMIAAVAMPIPRISVAANSRASNASGRRSPMRAWAALLLLLIATTTLTLGTAGLGSN